ncbi:DUF5700 domain-containing putative Zn-dependent protease [Candidatus Lokiarchaeum ossiferum]|uniref:DUF5700 domain-containing putative Zn-dependent protease n=1 Tax=Candidatus Lokiarchaeum ossiferum TaxID=2951803 RepID=UPI00352DB3AC
MQKIDLIEPLHISFQKATLEQMIHIFKNLREPNANKIAIRQQLEMILDHPDYVVEFSRYGNRVQKSELIDFILNFQSIEKSSIKNEDLLVRFDHFKYLIKHVDDYQSKLDLIESIFTPEIIKEQGDLALKGLPKGTQFGKVTFLFTVGIGMSFGYPHQTEDGRKYIHFDFIQLIKEFTPEQIRFCIGHEIHHIAMNEIHDSLDIVNMPLEQLFFLLFSGEGLAVKYCNNAKGILSQPLYPDLPENIGLDRFSWEYLNNDFENTFQMFRNHIQMIRNGEITSQDQLMALFQKYWMNDKTAEQSPDESPRLKQSRFYSFGNEIWGLLHDKYGIEKVYNTIYNMGDFLSLLNKALIDLNLDQI